MCRVSGARQNEGEKRDEETVCACGSGDRRHRVCRCGDGPHGDNRPRKRDFDERDGANHGRNGRDGQQRFERRRHRAPKHAQQLQRHDHARLRHARGRRNVRHGARLQRRRGRPRQGRPQHVPLRRPRRRLDRPSVHEHDGQGARGHLRHLERLHHCGQHPADARLVREDRSRHAPPRRLGIQYAGAVEQCCRFVRAGRAVEVGTERERRLADGRFPEFSRAGRQGGDRRRRRHLSHRRRQRSVGGRLDGGGRRAGEGGDAGDRRRKRGIRRLDDAGRVQRQHQHGAGEDSGIRGPREGRSALHRVLLLSRAQQIWLLDLSDAVQASSGGTGWRTVRLQPARER